MEVSVSLFAAMTAWLGGSVRFRAVNTKLSDVKTHEQNIFLEFLDLCKTHMEKLLSALQLR